MSYSVLQACSWHGDICHACMTDTGTSVDPKTLVIDLMTSYMRRLESNEGIALDAFTLLLTHLLRNGPSFAWSQYRAIRTGQRIHACYLCLICLVHACELSFWSFGQTCRMLLLSAAVAHPQHSCAATSSCGRSY